MIADMIDKPSHSDVVDMLQAFPREEAEFDSREENVVIQGASSERIFQKVTEQYGFIGGGLEQYVSYFARRLPQNMWA